MLAGMMTDVLSQMTITRERQSDYTGRETGWRCDACAGKRSDAGIRNLH